MIKLVSSVMAANQQTASSSSPLHDDHDEDNSVTLPSLWTSASLENIILNLTRKYCSSFENLNTSDSLNNAVSLENLREPQSVQKLRFDAHDDLRFADHADHIFNSYNISAFPSTDGMDRLSHNSSSYNKSVGGLSGLEVFPSHQSPAACRPKSENLSTNQFQQKHADCSGKFDSNPSIHNTTTNSRIERIKKKRNTSCKVSSSFGAHDYPSLPSTRRRPSFLSRTTQSASDAVPNTYGALSKATRLCDSTPNLKVSRYETAFGPHDKTVTRIYFQKGVSTERLNGKRKSDGEKETCFDAHPKSNSPNNSFDSSKLRSSPNIHKIPQGATLGRSKSFADVDSSTKLNSSFEPCLSNTLSQRPRHDSNCESRDSLNHSKNYSSRSLHQNSMNVAISESGSHSYNSLNNQFKSSNSTTSLNNNRENYMQNAVDLTESSPLSDILESSPSYGPGYRYQPVLDGAKRLKSRKYDPYVKHGRPNSHFLRTHQVTSTPLDPDHFCDRNKQQKHFNQFDNITPFVKSNLNRDTPVTENRYNNCKLILMLFVLCVFYWYFMIIK